MIKTKPNAARRNGDITTYVFFQYLLSLKKNKVKKHLKNMKLGLKNYRKIFFSRFK